MYIGHYFTILAVNQWHDESNWPEHSQLSEMEERRRLVGQCIQFTSCRA
jgi:hypothetical protein